MKTQKLLISILFLILFIIGFKLIINNYSKPSIIQKTETGVSNLSSVKNKGGNILSWWMFLGC